MLKDHRQLQKVLEYQLILRYHTPTDSRSRIEKRKPQSSSNLVSQRKNFSPNNRRYLLNLGPSLNPLVSHNKLELSLR